MCNAIRTLFTVVVVSVATAASAAHAQDNPYRAVEGWAKLPDRRTWGATAGADVDARDHVWVFERCGANSCAGSDLAPILEFDQSGKLLKSFGAGMFVFPHGIHVDKDGNVWVTDAQGKDGKGHQVFSSARRQGLADAGQSRRRR
jgi:streptogramin lyase